MSPTPRELEEFAEDCVRLAEQADTPELRAKLLNLAQEWMQSAMQKTPEASLSVQKRSALVASHLQRLV